MKEDKELNILQTVVIAFALSVDCFAVSFSCGAKTDTTPARALRIAFVFGLAHVASFSAGWIMGAWFRLFYQDHIFISIAYFTAFLLLCGAGAHMIATASSNKRECGRGLKSPAFVISLAFATSLDAFLAGIGLAILFVPVGLTVFVLGVFAVSMSFCGLLTGDKSGRSFKQNAGVAGGVIMIAAGLWILIGSFLQA